GGRRPDVALDIFGDLELELWRIGPGRDALAAQMPLHVIEAVEPLRQALAEMAEREFQLRETIERARGDDRQHVRRDLDREPVKGELHPLPHEFGKARHRRLRMDV